MMYMKLDKQVLKDHNLKPLEKLVMIYLIAYNNSDCNYSFPTWQQIQEDTGISKNTLSKIFNSLENQGYIKRQQNPNKGGRNNIYYIYKYVINDTIYHTSPQKSQREVLDCSMNDLSKEETENLTESIKHLELSTNERLIENKSNINHKLTNEQKEILNKLDTDRLMKAIQSANRFAKGMYSFNYLITIYKNQIKKYVDKPKVNKPKANKPVSDKPNKIKTKYHNTFNEHYKDYEPDDLEKKLLKMQGRLSYAGNL